MKPCSAWCRPDEGVHVILGASTEGAFRRDVGTVYITGGPQEGCLPEGTEVLILDEEKAVEVDPADAGVTPWWPIAILTTVRVLP